MLWAENSFNILSLQLGPASKVRIFPPSFSPWQPQMPPMMSVGGEWATETIYRHSFLSLSVFLFLFYLYANFLNSLLCWKKNLYSQNNKFSLSLMSAFLSRLSQTESTLQTALEFLTGSQSVSNPNPCFSTSVFTLLFFSPCSIFTFWQWNHYVCVGLQLKSCTGWLLASTLDDCIRVSLCIYCGID